MSAREEDSSVTPRQKLLATIRRKLFKQPRYSEYLQAVYLSSVVHIQLGQPSVIPPRLVL